MLHIIWLIIKLILILTGILLGLALLLVLLVLFVPLTYRLKGEVSQGKLAGYGKLSWLFRGISFKVSYIEKEVVFDFRILGIPVLRIMEKRKEKKEQKTKSKEKREREIRQDIPEPLPLSVQNTVSEKTEEKLSQHTASEEKLSQHTVSLDRGKDQDALVMTETSRRKKFSFFEYLKKPWKMLKTWIKRIRNGLKKIKLTFRSICDKIRHWKNFLEEEKVKEAIRLVWKEGKGLCRHIWPRKLKGRVVFGMEDPVHTGEILAILGMTCPIHKNQIQIVPVFDRKILEGEAQCRGRVYGIVLLMIALRLYFDNNIKYVWNRWKHKEV